MARVTARQAFERARSRREPRSKQVRRISNIGIISKINQRKIPLGGQGSISCSEPVNDAPASESQQIVRPNSIKRKPRVRANLKDNKKITDYFPVLLRGRENLKSPSPITRSPTRGSHNLADNELNRSSDIQSTRDNSLLAFVNSSFNDPYKGPSKIPLSQHPTSSSSFNVRNNPITSQRRSYESKIDDDIECVGMLLPIAQRDHPVVDLD